MARRCCFAIASSFCCAIRNREIDSLSCTFSLFCVRVSVEPWLYLACT